MIVRVRARMNEEFNWREYNDFEYNYDYDYDEESPLRE